MNDQTIGLIETRGIVALTAAIEAMLKTSDVTCIGIERVAAGYFVVAVQGSLAAVRQAVEAGKNSVQQYGVLRSADIFPKPHDQAYAALDLSLGKQINGTAQLPPGKS